MSKKSERKIFVKETKDDDSTYETSDKTNLLELLDYVYVDILITLV